LKKIKAKVDTNYQTIQHQKEIATRDDSGSKRVLSYKKDQEQREKAAKRKRELSYSKVQTDVQLDKRIGVLETKEKKLEYELSKIDGQYERISEQRFAKPKETG
jgi:hypothetical protein